jgi:hypothetical protein
VYIICAQNDPNNVYLSIYFTSSIHDMPDKDKKDIKPKPVRTPEEIAADAYSGGSDINIKPGDEAGLPHEGTHTVPQTPPTKP